MPYSCTFSHSKYKGVCLCFFSFCLIGVLREVREVATPFSVGSGDSLGDSYLSSTSSFPFPFSYLSFSSSSPSSSSPCSSLSSLAYSSVSSPLSSSSSSISSSSLSTSPSSLSITSSSLSLIVGLLVYSRAFISSYVCMSLKFAHVIGILRFWRACSMMSLVNP